MILEYEKRLVEKPSKLIVETTTVLGANASYTSPKFINTPYKYIKIYVYANVDGYFGIYMYDIKDKVIYNSTQYYKGGADRHYFYIPHGAKCEIAFTNGAVAQTTFTFRAEGYL